MTNPVLTTLRARVRQAVARDTLPMNEAQHPGRFDWQTGDPHDSASLIARFAKELEPLGGIVHRVASSGDATAWIVDFVRRTGSKKILSWGEQALGLSGLGAALVAAGAELPTAELPVDHAAREAHLAVLGECDLGLSGADYGLADTGSLVVTSGPGRARLASLLPPVHVAVLPVRLLVWSLSDALAASPQLAASGSNFVVITGPSRTADIEMTLTRGVHGPRDLHVVLVG